jgi:hypothetical protein
MDAVLQSSEMSDNTSASRRGNPKEGHQLVDNRRESLSAHLVCAVVSEGVKHLGCESNHVPLLCGGMPPLTITSSWWGVLLTTEVDVFSLPLRRMCSTLLTF